MLKKKIKKELEKDNNILALYIYGSRSSGKQNKRSDTDVAMLLGAEVEKAKYSDYRFKYLAKLDDFIKSRLDFIILNQVPSILQFQVLKNGKLLYDPDPDRRAELELNILNNYYLSKKFYEFHFLNLRKNIKERGLGCGHESNRSSTEEVRRISEKLNAISGSKSG